MTNGLALDTQPLNVPVAVQRGPGPVITFEFDGQPQLGGYSVWTALGQRRHYATAEVRQWR